MYDARSEAHEFVASSRDEAVAKATSFFQMGEDELVVSELGHDVAGLAGRVVVVARPANAPAPRADRGDRERGDRERGGRGGRDRERGDRDRGGRGRGRDRDRDRDRDRNGGGRERSARGGRDRDRDRDRDRGGNRGDEARFDDDDRERAPQIEPSGEPSVGNATTELDDTGEYVKGILERMELGPFEISQSSENDGEFVIYQLRGEAAQRLTGAEGRAADALQFLAAQSVQRREDGSTKRVVIDAEGDADGRTDLLERAASRAAKRALDTGRAVALDPMNPRDRRAIHVALRDEEGIATMSIGSGRYRQVLVVPEGAPEYEEARDTADRAASD